MKCPSATTAVTTSSISVSTITSINMSCWCSWDLKKPGDHKPRTWDIYHTIRYHTKYVYIHSSGQPCLMVANLQPTTFQGLHCRGLKLSDSKKWGDMVTFPYGKMTHFLHNPGDWNMCLKRSQLDVGSLHPFYPLNPIYHLINKHNYGTSPVLVGKSTIHGHFQQLLLHVYQR